MTQAPSDAELVAAYPLGTERASPLAWTEASHQLAEAQTYWLATTRPDGRPHVRPILAVWVDGALHFAASLASRKGQYLRQNPSCAVTSVTPGLDVVLEGGAARVTDVARLHRVAETYAAKYGWPVTVRDGAFYAEGAPTAGPPPFHIFEISPTAVFAFATDETFAGRSTRWRFARRA